MADQNMTTNEDLRSRWNGNPKNKVAVAVYREKTNFINRLYFYMFVRYHESHLSNILKFQKDDFARAETDTALEDIPFLDNKEKPISNIGILKQRYGINLFDICQN